MSTLVDLASFLSPDQLVRAVNEADRLDLVDPEALREVVEALPSRPETDGLRYHRTPAQQAEDRRRDQVHTAAGLTTIRFAESQIRYEAEHVRGTLAAVTRRLESQRVT